MYTSEGKLWIATGEEPIMLNAAMANRHGLIAGATGTGKTISLKVMAETLSTAGVPVFMVDIKGDVCGIAKTGEENKHVTEQLEKCRVTEEFSFKEYPTMFWDVYGEKGIPVRTTVSHMGPILLARLLGLNPTQEGVLEIAFRIADDEQLLLIDIKDLRAMLLYVADNAKEIQAKYGNVSAQSVGAITRALLSLENAGGDIFFGEPELDIRDWIRTNSQSAGIINVLDCVKLANQPLLYSTFLLWLLTDLYEILPEVGDLDKPRMVFFFDEAHMLFNDAPKALVEKIEQVVRLIRSKGVGIFFITQNPADIPETILAQLGNRIQHALRAFTPAEQKAVKTAAQTFRPNPAFDTEEAILVLGTGEALVSFLDEEGAPAMVQRAFILPPQSFMGPCGDDVRQKIVNSSEFYLKYKDAVDNRSAYEELEEERQEKEKAEAEAEAEKERIKQEKEAEKERIAREKEEARQRREQEREEDRQRREQEREAAKREKELQKKFAMVNKVASSAMNQIGREVGRKVLRGIFGNLKW